jgi:hypothetical protein
MNSTRLNLLSNVNLLTHGPRANKPYKFQMTYAQKVLKRDESHTPCIPLLVHLVSFTIIGIPNTVWPNMPDNCYLSLNPGHTNGPQLTATC